MSLCNCVFADMYGSRIYGNFPSVHLSGRVDVDLGKVIVWRYVDVGLINRHMSVYRALRVRARNWGMICRF